jgi:hypothetical protein
MATVQFQWSCNVGEDALFTLTVYEADNVTPQNISGWNMATLVQLPGDLSPRITKTTSSGMTILAQSGATLGQVTILISRADTLGLQPGIYDSFVERTDTGAFAWTDRGTFFLMG